MVGCEERSSRQEGKSFSETVSSSQSCSLQANLPSTQRLVPVFGRCQARRYHYQHQDHSNCPLCGVEGEKVSRVLHCPDPSAVSFATDRVGSILVSKLTHSRENRRGCCYSSFPWHSLGFFEALFILSLATNNNGWLLFCPYWQEVFCCTS